MSDSLKFILLNLPSPIGHSISRDYAGGFGILGEANELLLPIYLLYGASALKQSGYDYDLLDTQAMGYSNSEVIEAVKKSEPEVLVSWISLPSIYDDLELLNKIKKVNPHVCIIALGTVCNVMPEEVLSKSDIDLVIRGMYPYYNLILNLVDTLNQSQLSRDMFHQIGGSTYIKENHIVHSPIEPVPENLDHLSFDVYYQLPLDKYIRRVPDANGVNVECISIITSAGCPYSCIYCPYPLGYGRRITHKSIALIVDEIEFLNTNFGITGFSFRDQLFTNDRQRIFDLCNEIINRGLKIRWHVEARADQVSEDLLSKMKEAGCFRIHYGVETGSPEMLKKIGKPGLDVDLIRNTFQITKKLDIATTAHMMLGLPGENSETLKKSIDLLRHINPDVANLNITTPYPGTKLFEMASKKGWISTYDWEKYTSYNAIISTGELSLEQVFEARRKMRKEFRNFKLLHDSNYRRLYLKSLPKLVYHRLTMFVKNMMFIRRR